MKTWTPDASDYFESWLGRVRLSIAGDPRVDANDVAEDLRAHVHAELAANEEPVTVGALERVLESLGNPAQWGNGAAGAAPQPKRSKGDWIQRNVLDVLADSQRQLGGDLGMPVVLVVLTVLGLPLFDEGFGLVLLGLAFFVARAYVVHAPERIAGRKKYAFYLPLAIGIGALTGLVLAFPIVLQGRSAGLESVWMLGAWWVIVGFIARREPRRVQSVLRPFADGFAPSHGRMLMLLGMAFLIASSLMGFGGGWNIDLN